jgi:hypothetical protein
VNAKSVSYKTITQGTTANFVIKYEDADRGLNANFTAAELSVVQSRAQQLVNACENDYSTLCSWWLGINFGAGFGASNRIIVTFTTSGYAGGTLGGASNQGYQSPSQIFINPYVDRTATSDDDAVLGLFVAELIEILMSYTKSKWNASYSNGEGLSRVASQLLHPGINSFPQWVAPGDVRPWFSDDPNTNFGDWKMYTSSGKLATSSMLPSHNAIRQDWVTTTFKGETVKTGDNVPGDQDWYSFGCAILFIYYLKNQLGSYMPDIVKNGGATLEETYKNVTGNSGGFAPFKALLDDFFPTNAPLLPTCNPFPLGGNFCRVNIASSPAQDAPPTVVKKGTAPVFFLGCGGGTWPYTFYNLHSRVRVIASIFGFANPVVQWLINGTKLSSVGSTTISVDAIVTTVDPSAPLVSKPEKVQLSIDHGELSHFQPNSIPPFSEYIDIVVNGNPGQVQLQIEVDVTDQFANPTTNVATLTGLVTVDTQQFTYDNYGGFLEKQDECMGRWRALHTLKLSAIRSIMPDPPPEILNAAAYLRLVSDELKELSRTDPKTAEQISRKLGGFLLGENRSSLG